MMHEPWHFGHWVIQFPKVVVSFRAKFSGVQPVIRDLQDLGCVTLGSVRCCECIWKPKESASTEVDSS